MNQGGRWGEIARAKSITEGLCVKEIVGFSSYSSWCEFEHMSDLPRLLRLVLWRFPQRSPGIRNAVRLRAY